MYLVKAISSSNFSLINFPKASTSIELSDLEINLKNGSNLIP